PVLSRDQTVRLFTESGRTVNLLVSRPSPGCSPSFSNSSPSTDDSRFYSNYAVYDVATIEEPKAPANPAAMTSRARPSRGHVPRMGTKGLPPASQQHQPPPPPPPPLPPQQHQQVATNTEWVVKRRPDGSRYVTRRPAKAKLRRAPGHPRAPAPAVDNDVDEQRGGEASGCDQADSSGDSAEIAEGVQKQRKRLTMAKLQLPEMQRQQSHLGIFSPQEATAVSNYFIDSYFRHFKMYKYVFNPQVQLDLTINYTAFPNSSRESGKNSQSTMADAFDQDSSRTQQNEDRFTAEDDEKQLEVSDQAPALIVGDSNPDGLQFDSDTDSMSALKRLIRERLKKEMGQLQASVSAQLQRSDEEINKATIESARKQQSAAAAAKKKK
uniref:CG14230 n=1 Tax=Macrostomum lignano TaxID=282301 RepID=A0A1I8IWT2_9PLAT